VLSNVAFEIFYSLVAVFGRDPTESSVANIIAIVEEVFLPGKTNMVAIFSGRTSSLGISEARVPRDDFKVPELF
jgi:hypothetical protein